MAEELARSSGTPDGVIQQVLSQDFLVICLRKAKFSADLLQDTVDACEINDLNALVLGSGLLSVTEASEKLFLMQDEASTVVTVCRKECLRAGVNFGDGAKLTPEELAEPDEEEPAAPAPVPAPAATPAVPSTSQQAPLARVPSGKAGPPPQKQSSKSGIGAGGPPLTATSSGSGLGTGAGTSSSAPAPVTAAAAQTPQATAPASASQRSTPLTGPSTSAEQPDPNFLIKPPVSASASAVGTPLGGSSTPMSATPHATRSNIPKPSFGTPSTPGPAVATPRERPAAKPVTRASPSTTTPQPSTSGVYAANTPMMNGRHTPVPGSSIGKPPRPSTAPLTSRASTTVPLGRDRPASAASTPSMPSGRLPSYAKPTASHQARLLKEDTDVPSTSTTPQVTFASTNKPLRRFLYMPPRTMSATPEEKKEPKKPVFDNIRSSLLRPTAAFLAWSSGKSKPAKEGDLKSSQKLQSEASGFSSRPPKAPNSAPPKSVTRADVGAGIGSPGATVPASTGGKATKTPEPFRLASAERHQKAQEELQRKIEEKARLESAIPKFKASPMPGTASRPGGLGSSPKRVTAAQTDA